MAQNQGAMGMSPKGRLLHLDIVRKSIVFQAERSSKFLEFCSDDVEVRYPIAHAPHPQILRGKEELIAYASEVSDSLPKLLVSDIEVEMLADGTSVLARFRYDTPTGSAMQYHSHYCTIARFDGNLISSYTMYFDAGALPEAGE